MLKGNCKLDILWVKVGIHNITWGSTNNNWQWYKKMRVFLQLVKQFLCNVVIHHHSSFIKSILWINKLSGVDKKTYMLNHCSIDTWTVYWSIIRYQTVVQWHNFHWFNKISVFDVTLSRCRPDSRTWRTRIL